MPRQPGIFGPTPQQVLSNQQDDVFRRAQAFGQMPLGALSGVQAGTLLGNAIGDATGFQNPQLRQAQASQEVQQEISQMGLQPGTPEFTQAVTNAFRVRGQEDMALQAFSLGRQLEQQEAATQRINFQAQGAGSEALTSAAEAQFAPLREQGRANKAIFDAEQSRLKAQGLPAEQAADLALSKARRVQAYASASASGASAESSRASAARTRQAIELDRQSAAAKLVRDAEKQGQQTFQNANVLRDDFGKVAGTAIETQQSWNRFQALAEQQTSVADTGMLVAFTKMLDPGSVAREGEVAAVANAISGFLGRVSKKIKSAGSTAVVLTADERRQLIEAAQGMAASNAEAFQDITQKFTDMSTRAGVDPANVITTAPQPIGQVGPSTIERLQQQFPGATIRRIE